MNGDGYSVGELYMQDPRFAKHYDVAAGLAQYVHDAIVADADSRS